MGWDSCRLMSDVQYLMRFNPQRFQNESSYQPSNGSFKFSNAQCWDYDTCMRDTIAGILQASSHRLPCSVCSKPFACQHLGFRWFSILVRVRQRYSSATVSDCAGCQVRVHGTAYICYEYSLGHWNEARKCHHYCDTCTVPIYHIPTSVHTEVHYPPLCHITGVIQGLHSNTLTRNYICTDQVISKL